MFSLLFRLSVLTLPLMVLMNIQNGMILRTYIEHRPPIVGMQKKWQHSYDYIIVGSGSAGSVLANRLSEDAYNSVLLLEAGGDEQFLSEIPIAYQLLQKSKLDWAYHTEPQKHACFGLKGRRSFWPRGRVLGGTSVLNVMLYTRGNPNDYNAWPSGWHWPDVYPYFLRSENNHDEDIARNGYHAQHGYLDVSRTPYVTPLGKAFVKSAHELGYPMLHDLNAHTQSGFAVPQTTNREGTRCSTAKAFLYPARKRKNLDILAHAMATRVSMMLRFNLLSHARDLRD